MKDLEPIPRLIIDGEADDFHRKEYDGRLCDHPVVFHDDLRSCPPAPYKEPAEQDVSNLQRVY